MDNLLSKLELQEKEINLYLKMIESYRKENEEQKEKIKKLENRYKRNKTEDKQKKFLELVEKLKNNVDKDVINLDNIPNLDKFDYKNIIYWLNENKDKLQKNNIIPDIKIYNYDAFLKFKKKLKNNNGM